MSGGGCGGSATNGQSGSYTVPAAASQTVALQVGLSYVPSNAVSGCATWANDFVDSPEPMYIKAIIDELASKYCVDKNKVFINGYSSGAWQAVMAGGCSNSDQVRAYAVQVGGGLRIKHPPCLNKPSAAMYVVGTMDTGNPIGPLAQPQNDSYGSAPARDAQLTTNGCQGTATMPWNPKYPKCVTYTGCPAKYPVVWCALDVDHGNGPMPKGADGYPNNGASLENYRLQGVWDFYASLPAP
jgi:poly(3-hydroxybutyrate) depolymerase